MPPSSAARKAGRGTPAIAAAALAVLVIACRSESAEPPVAVQVPVPTSSAGWPLVQDGDAVYFVGNSFLAWQGRPLPEWVRALGAASTSPIRIEVGSNIVFGNHPLSWFLTHPATQAALASRKYRVFVLQGEELEPVDHPAEFRRAVIDFHRAVRAAGGRTVLFMTWQLPWRPMIDRLAAAYDQLGVELGIPVIPVGLIYQDCDRRPYRDERPYWLTASPERPDGDLHPNAMGAAVNAYATFQLLTGRNPRGKIFDAPGASSDDGRMRYSSDMALERVAPRLPRALLEEAERPR
jgi:hypothetical protein